MKAQIPQDGDYDNDLPPEFALSAWNGEDGDRSDIRLMLHTTTRPSSMRHASMGLLYGLAIMVLDQQGTISETIDAILSHGPLSESEAVSRINFLLQEDLNEAAI